MDDDEPEGRAGQVDGRGPAIVADRLRAGRPGEGPAGTLADAGRPRTAVTRGRRTVRPRRKMQPTVRSAPPAIVVRRRAAHYERRPRSRYAPTYRGDAAWAWAAPIVPHRPPPYHPPPMPRGDRTEPLPPRSSGPTTALRVSRPPAAGQRKPDPPTGCSPGRPAEPIGVRGRAGRCLTRRSGPGAAIQSRAAGLGSRGERRRQPRTRRRW